MIRTEERMKKTDGRRGDNKNIQFVDHTGA